MRQGEWFAGRGDLVTEAVVTCIVLAGHNTATGRGLLGHFSAISPLSAREPTLANEIPDTPAFLAAIRRLPLLGPLTALDIWIGGAATVPPGPAAAAVLADRQYAVDTLRNALPPHRQPATVTVEWSLTPDELTVTLWTQSGLLRLRTLPDR